MAYTASAAPSPSRTVKARVDPARSVYAAYLNPLSRYLVDLEGFEQTTKVLDQMWNGLFVCNRWDCGRYTQ